jgi:hypothetical protein
MRKTRDDIASIRTLTAVIVRKLEPLCGSRMLAYEKVAAAAGVSASWVRKFITVDDTAEPRWSVGCALARYYESICDDLDQRADAERKQIKKILEVIHEAGPSAPKISLPSFLAPRSGPDRLDHSA